MPRAVLLGCARYAACPTSRRPDLPGGRPGQGRARRVGRGGGSRRGAGFALDTGRLRPQRDPAGTRADASARTPGHSPGPNPEPRPTARVPPPARSPTAGYAPAPRPAAPPRCASCPRGRRGARRAASPSSSTKDRRNSTTSPDGSSSDGSTSAACRPTARRPNAGSTTPPTPHRTGLSHGPGPDPAPLCATTGNTSPATNEGHPRPAATHRGHDDPRCYPTGTTASPTKTSHDRGPDFRQAPREPGGACAVLSGHMVVVSTTWLLHWRETGATTWLPVKSRDKDQGLLAHWYPAARPHQRD